LAGGFVPVVLGGDHSVAVGTVSGVAKASRERGENIGLIWLDAHADMNTPESSPSGNIHGMPLACVAGAGPRELTELLGPRPKVPSRNVVIVGLRDVDQVEKAHIHESGVRAFTMRDIDERGMRAVMDDAIRIATEGTAGFHLSLDMDFVDPADAPGVGTPVRGGATYREAHLAMEMICDSGKMIAMEVVEVNPVIDESNRTASLAVELIMSGLGKRIL
jgi:arginase